ncbi:MAG: FAD-dependent oxidoreductase, partial [Defluviitaleaceae bacterium]|nr:FAD-dependent oxidoreductase [Defluviitaleaceae bacterium]
MSAAAACGIAIPTLCSDERVKPYGACGICVVEAENSPKLLRACSTFPQAGMRIKTDTPRVLSVRKSALELMLSDHKGDCTAPCKGACPANTDCQGYVGLIANGEYGEAAALIREKLPLPASVGRVCPHPCETKCRRALVEEPINIAGLKSFAADRGGISIPEIKESTNKRIAVIGGGPGGLTAAYFLRLQGHAVTVYDAMPKAGGMLRYGVPEYRLPKKVLSKETDAIESMGVKFIGNTKIGGAGQPALAGLRKSFDAVIVAIGAWKGVRLGCEGEQLKNVIGGIEFLRDVKSYENTIKGKRVAVVGGGDTAMDACRTAVRLGAAAVYDVYRRSLSEMPANQVEIDEAMEEGVIFKCLHNPIEIIGKEAVTGMRLQKMELGEPDASGRRSPVPIKGAEETLAVD